ncbi:MULTISPECIES: hypothetical protein [Staphylococcaceae]|uniref:hypothetical protein n=1 Tax=Staphylococcaceae TaxID=90964 RepID=UPI00155DB126|nr:MULTISPECIES: hypothetical protein [Staphylococcaceae]MEB7846342.1 hypothetical protein [Mammaliicoccus sciuri]
MKESNKQVLDFKEIQKRKEEEESRLSIEEEREIQELMKEFEKYSNSEDYE